MPTSLRDEIHSQANSKKAKVLMGFFKTGPGEYSEEDQFLGLTVPQIRKIAKKHSEIDFTELKNSIESPFNDERLTALLILVDQFARAEQSHQKKIYEFYLKNIKHVNNWNLVDSSAHKIIGAWLFKRDRKVIKAHAKSKDLWIKRISILSCFYFIQQNEFPFALEIIQSHLKDEHDLIHKACGWMLREIGKRDQKVLIRFLKKNYQIMPRTCLRYAIERFPESTRKKYLIGKF